MRTSLIIACAGLGFAAALLRPTGATLAALRGACATSAGADCEALGDRLAREASARQYAEEPGLAFAMACEAGRAAACDRAQAWARPYGDYEVLELDVGCMVRRNAFACEEVASALRDEQNETGVPGAANDTMAADPRQLARSRMTRALALYVADCTRAEAASCLGASRVYAAAFGVAWDLRQAHAYAARACELGSAEACEQEADAATGAAAIALYRKACGLRPGAPHAWLKLARAEEAAGAAPTEVAARYRQACERLAFEACDRVAPALPDLAAAPPALAQAMARWCDDAGQASDPARLATCERWRAPR